MQKKIEKKEQVMKIGFIGAQCSGKTTTICSVYAKLKELGYNNVAMISERARECPYSIADSYALFKTENWILLNQILAEEALEDKWDFILCDRTVFDEIIYFAYAREESIHKALRIKEVFEMAKKMNYFINVVNEWIKIRPYKHLFLFRPLPFVSDADRVNDIKWQQGIDKLFMEYFEKREDVTIIGHKEKNERIRFVLNKLLEYMG